MTDTNGEQPTQDPADDTGAKTTSEGLASNAAQILETIKDAIDDFAERAEPTVRVVSARVAEMASTAATKAAPLAKKAGDATAEGAEKLAVRSKEWAADVRQTIANAADAVDGDHATPTPPAADATTTTSAADTGGNPTA